MQPQQEVTISDLDPSSVSDPGSVNSLRRRSSALGYVKPSSLCACARHECPLEALLCIHAQNWPSKLMLDPEAAPTNKDGRGLLCLLCSGSRALVSSDHCWFHSMRQQCSSRVLVGRRRSEFGSDPDDLDAAVLSSVRPSASIGAFVLGEPVPTPVVFLTSRALKKQGVP